MVGLKVLQIDKGDLLDVFSSFVKLFSSLIKHLFLSREIIDESALTLYYVIRKVVKWSGMLNISNEFVENLCELIRQVLKKRRDDMKDIVTLQERLNPSIKLFVLLDITADDDVFDRKFLKVHLSSYPKIKEQLYTRVSTDLKGKQDSYVVQAFSLASRYDE